MTLLPLSRCARILSMLSSNSKPASIQSRLFVSSVSPDSEEISKVEGPAFEGLFTPEFKVLIDLFHQHKHELRVAGGAVRDILGGVAPADVDLATTATPQEMLRMAKEVGMRTIKDAGAEKHGTVTFRPMNSVNYEVTTLRVDMVTDGRHAQVEFTHNWRLDAERRDLTVNSMFIGLDGTLYDYFGGRDDLKRKRIAFVGDAEIRIREDYLRILRYFRFYGRLSAQPDCHESSTLDAIRRNVEGMTQISGERIWSEWKKILNGPFAGPITQRMIDVGLSKYLGLPSEPNVNCMLKVWERSLFGGVRTSLQPPTLLAALIGCPHDADRLQARLKCSGYERDLIKFVIERRNDSISLSQSSESEKKYPLKVYQTIVATSSRKADDVKRMVEEVLKYRGDFHLLRSWQQWQLPRFPVNGFDLKEAGCPKGRLMGKALEYLKDLWIESDFGMDKEELLSCLPEFLKKLEVEDVGSSRAKKFRETSHRDIPI